MGCGSSSNIAAPSTVIKPRPMPALITVRSSHPQTQLISEQMPMMPALVAKTPTPTPAQIAQDSLQDKWQRPQSASKRLPLALVAGDQQFEKFINLNNYKLTILIN